MKLIGPAGTELRHILAIYIMCSCDLDFWPTFSKIGSRDPEFLLSVHAYLKIYRRCSFWYIRSLTADLVAPLEATVVAMATILRLTRWGVVLMSASKNEVYDTTRNGVMAHFTLIHYMPIWPRSLTYFQKNGSCDLDHILKICAYFEVISLCIFDIFDHKMQISSPC